MKKFSTYDTNIMVKRAIEASGHIGVIPWFVLWAGDRWFNNRTHVADICMIAEEVLDEDYQGACP